MLKREVKLQLTRKYINPKVHLSQQILDPGHGTPYSARVGLLSLTIADILCCVASLVVAVGAAERTMFQSGDDVLRMLIVAYGPYVQNALAKSSTWLVVVTWTSPVV